MAHDPLNQAGSPALDDTPRAAATPHAHGEPPESSGSDNDTDDGHRRNMHMHQCQWQLALPMPVATGIASHKRGFWGRHSARRA